MSGLVERREDNTEISIFKQRCRLLSLVWISVCFILSGSSGERQLVGKGDSSVRVVS